MSTASPAFAFPVPTEPLVLTAGRDLAAMLAAGQIVSRTVLNTVMAEHFGGCDAAGRWSVRDAHAALELAEVLFLHGAESLTGDMPTDLAERVFGRLEAQVLSQTNRSDEQIEWQQFATPPRLAWIAARACALSADDQVLEPSAGTGMLAVWAVMRVAIDSIRFPSEPHARSCFASRSTSMRSFAVVASKRSTAQAGLLIGRDRLMRLNAPLLPDGPIGLDDVKRAKAELPNVAKELALANGPAVASRFFNEKAEPYVPFHP